MKRKSNKKDFADYYSKKIVFAWEDSNPWTSYNQGADCCADGHQTFYGAIMKSPQWNEWYDEQMRRFADKDCELPMFDIDECIGIGTIGDHHLQEFFKFIKAN